MSKRNIAESITSWDILQQFHTNVYTVHIFNSLKEI